MKLVNVKLALATFCLSLAFQANAATSNNAYVICSKGENPDVDAQISTAMQLTPSGQGWYKVTYQAEVRDAQGYSQMYEREAHVNRCVVETIGKSKRMKRASCLSNDS